MRIGLVQADGGQFPNMALMQISGYHEYLGDKVEWWQGPLFQYDRVYVSKIFSFSQLPIGLPADAIIGGTGIDFKNRLPSEIEQAQPSWTLFGKFTYHIGFTQKGCRLACKFCCVPQKEGRPRHQNDIDEMLTNPIGSNRLMLLDNDFFGGPKWRENLERIIVLKLRVCFVQGLNIRIITPEQAAILAQVRYTNSKFNQRYLTFAWDRYDDRHLIEKGIRICNEAGIPTRHMQFFVLIGFDTTPEQDFERVMMLSDQGAMPFVMPYNRKDPYQKSFTRWVNNRAVFKSCTWDEYKYRTN